ncbi:MAG: hypothetical protein AB1725_07665 [Armatimonadota bacterium]
MIAPLVASVLVLSFGSYAQEPETQAPAGVDLTRVWTTGETQDYILELTMESDAFEGEKFEGVAEFTVKVLEAREGGDANVQTSVTKVTLKFGGEEFPAMDPPQPIEALFGPNGLPKKLTLDNPDDPIALVLPALFVPATEVKVGEEFKVDWASEDGAITLKGSGKLTATGRLYEEHVARLTMQIKAEGEELPTGEFELLTFVNSKTRKLVKAEGTLVGEDPDLGEKMTVTFVIRKVRDV